MGALSAKPASSRSRRASRNSTSTSGGEPSGAGGERKLLGFMEEGAEDLKSSTEELHFTEEPGTVEEQEARRRADRQRQRKESTQSCHPELAPHDKERKDSACSADIAFLSISGRTSRLSSVGSAASGCSGASHLSSASRISGAASRSPSPGRMLLETSFCGTKASPEAVAAALRAKQERRDRGGSGKRTVERQAALEDPKEERERERHVRVIAARRADEVRRAQGREPRQRDDKRRARMELEVTPDRQTSRSRSRGSTGSNRSKKKSKEDELVRIIPLHSSDELESEDGDEEEEEEEVVDQVGPVVEGKRERKKPPLRRNFEGLDDKEDLEVQRRKWLETHVSREEDPELVRIIPLRTESVEYAERERERREGQGQGQGNQRRISPTPPKNEPSSITQKTEVGATLRGDSSVFTAIPEDLQPATFVPKPKPAVPAEALSSQRGVVNNAAVNMKVVSPSPADASSTASVTVPTTAVVQEAEAVAVAPSPRVPGRPRGPLPRRKVDPNALVRIIPLHSEDSYEGYGEEDLPPPPPSEGVEAAAAAAQGGGSGAPRKKTKCEGVATIVDEIDMSKWREPSFEETDLVRIIPLKVGEEEQRREEEDRKLREQQRCFKEHMTKLKLKQHTSKRPQREEDSDLVKIIPLHGSDSDNEREAEKLTTDNKSDRLEQQKHQQQKHQPHSQQQQQSNQQQHRPRRKLSDTRRSPIMPPEDELVRIIPLHSDDEEVPISAAAFAAERRETRSRSSSRRTSPRPSAVGDANNNSNSMVCVIPLPVPVPVHGPEDGSTNVSRSSSRNGSLRLEAKRFEPDNLVQMIQLHDSDSEAELAGYDTHSHARSRRSSSRPGSARSEQVEPLQIVPLGDPEDETGVSFVRRDLVIQGRLTPQPAGQENTAHDQADATKPISLDLGTRCQLGTSPKPRRKEAESHADTSRTPSPTLASSRKSSLSSIFFRKATEIVSPESPSSSGKRRLTNILKDPRSKSRDRAQAAGASPTPGPSPTPEYSRQRKDLAREAEKEVRAKDSKGGVLSTLFRKKSIPEPAAAAPAPAPDTEAQHPIQELELEFTFKCEATFEELPSESVNIPLHLYSPSCSEGERGQQAPLPPPPPPPPEVPRKTSPPSRSSWPTPPPPLDTNANPSADVEEDRRSSGSELEGIAPAPSGAAGADEEEDHETKGLVLQQDSFEDELPYVPTTLPMERPVAVPLVPAKQRVAEVRTCPIDRPRSTTPINPASLEEYVGPDGGREMSPALGAGAGAVAGGREKLRISLPREDSMTRRSRPQTKPWHDFASQALKPRSESQSPPPPLPPRAPSTTPPSTWVNFDDLPEKRKAPVRIQTIPSRGSIVTEPPSSHGAGAGAGPGGSTHSHAHVHYVDPEDCRCECHESDQPASSSSRPTPTPQLTVPCRPPKAPPFGMDLGVSSNRSSVASQNEHSSPEIPD